MRSCVILTSLNHDFFARVGADNRAGVQIVETLCLWLGRGALFPILPWACVHPLQRVSVQRHVDGFRRQVPYPIGVVSKTMQTQPLVNALALEMFERPHMGVLMTLLLPGDPPVEVLLRRSARARRLSLRISRLDGRVTLTLPTRVPEREANGLRARTRDRGFANTSARSHPRCPWNRAVQQFCLRARMSP